MAQPDEAQVEDLERAEWLAASAAWFEAGFGDDEYEYTQADARQP